VVHDDRAQHLPRRLKAGRSAHHEEYDDEIHGASTHEGPEARRRATATPARCMRASPGCRASTAR
jgi:hypothetical protein